jgi:hypothetical protein
MGATATQGKSAMPGPAEVGAKVWQHLKDPFYDKGTTDKGIGIQLAYAIACVGLGDLLAGPVGFLIGMSPPMSRARRQERREHASQSRTRRAAQAHNTIRRLITFLSNMSRGPLSNGTLHLYF